MYIHLHTLTKGVLIVSAKCRNNLMLRMSDDDLTRLDALVAIDHSTRSAVLRKGITALEDRQEKIERLCSGEVARA